MNKITQFEDLSNDLVLEIFEYFHALDLFTAFASLNNRLSSLLLLTQLHIVISKVHSRHQIKFLSSHLTHHAHQVISVSLQDQLYNFTSVIPFFFNQHQFINLQSCVFYSICPSSKLNRVIRQLKTLTKLETFRIIQSHNASFPDAWKRKLSKTILKHKSSHLRIVDLAFRYDYRYLTDSISVNWTLTSLHMMFQGATEFCSIYSILPILQTYRVLRHLYVCITKSKRSTRSGLIAPIRPSNIENHLPISPSITSFDLVIETMCDFDSLSIILRCMPNLRRLIFQMIIVSDYLSFLDDLFDGHYWQQLLTNDVPHTEIFDLSLTVLMNPNSQLDINTIIPSFDYFARKYDDWYVTINQSKCGRESLVSIVNLNASRYSNMRRYNQDSSQYITLDTFKMCSTVVQEHLLLADVTKLGIDVPLNTANFHKFSTFPPFRNVDDLWIRYKHQRTNFWTTVMKLIHILPDDKIKQTEHFNQLASLIDFNKIITLSFYRTSDLSQSYLTELVLSSSPNVVQLKIPTALFLSSTIFDNASAISSFAQLQSLNLITKKVYFPVKYASKLVKTCPLLIHIEFRLFSLDIRALIINILLRRLANLLHLKIHYDKYTSFDHLCSIDYVTEKRRKAFPRDINNKDEVAVKVNKQFLEIYLKSCSICANNKCYI